MTHLGIGTPQRALKPDAQPFDEIRLFVEPRFKEGLLSGDEWRISIHAEFMRNGKVIKEVLAGRDMEQACGRLYALLTEQHDKGNGRFAGEDNICDQEGCKAKATVKCTLKKEYCRIGHEGSSDAYRLFCVMHKNRGDSSLEDRDSNYIKEPLGEETK